MNQKTVYQTDLAGHYVGVTVADESPLEPDVWLMPAGTIAAAPPTAWPQEQWPRWNGTRWDLVSRPTPSRPEDAITKLRAFLAANPDVAEILGTQ